MASDIRNNAEYGKLLRGVVVYPSQESVNRLSRFINDWVNFQSKIDPDSIKFLVKSAPKEFPKRGPKPTISDALIAAIRYDYDVALFSKSEIAILYVHLLSKSSIYSVCNGTLRPDIIASQGQFHQSKKGN